MKRVAALLLICMGTLMHARVSAAESLDCRVGSYLLADGRIVDVSRPDQSTLRWRQLDGTTGALHAGPHGIWTGTLGWTERIDGTRVRFGSCEKGAINFNGVPGRRLDFDVTDYSFSSHGTKLVGRLLMPKGTSKVPVTVLLHGSEHDSALSDYSLQRMLPAQGIGAFVYDKRGTGQSGGTYTQDFELLADDAVAAAEAARQVAGSRLSRLGYQAGSQGGWVAPIAASRTTVDFVIVCFGQAVSVIDEDQQAVDIQLREKGYTPNDIEQALQVARAAEAVFASGFRSGFEHLNAVRDKYHDARWYKDLRGDFTWLLLPRSETELRAMATDFNWGTPFYYDPLQTLATGRTPELWILGGEDYEAPSKVTRERLELLVDAGRPLTVAYYPKAEHGMTLFELTPDGSRASTQYAPGYFKMMRDFIFDGRATGEYGDAQVTGPHRPRLRALRARVTRKSRAGLGASGEERVSD